ncbi:MAG: hypothetical protein B6226_04235 [Candidatus Cloacimonetes bacterium 4572_65]|nr:MAG: hypothetical protein B6226_04235 [Candidatus Cloacimonetes bacterium 4572_65]
MRVFIPDNSHLLCIRFDTVKCILSKTKNMDCKSKSAFINGDIKGLTKGCDYIIFHKKESKLYVIFIECKSDSHEPKQVNYQLQNGSLFVDYLIALLKLHAEKDSVFQEKEVDIVKKFLLLKTAKKIRARANHFDQNKKYGFAIKENYQKNATGELKLTLNQLIKLKAI